MKKAFAIILAVAAMAVLFSTCKKEAEPTTVDECISNFMDDINSTDRSEVYENLDSGSAQYNEAKATIFWDYALFPTTQIPYSLSSQSESGSTVSANLTSNGGLYSGTSIVFTMGEDSDKNAVISKITISGTVRFQ
jgi:hypothetical protein